MCVCERINVYFKNRAERLPTERRPRDNSLYWYCTNNIEKTGPPGRRPRDNSLFHHILDSGVIGSAILQNTPDETAPFRLEILTEETYVDFSRSLKQWTWRIYFLGNFGDRHHLAGSLRQKKFHPQCMALYPVKTERDSDLMSNGHQILVLLWQQPHLIDLKRKRGRQILKKRKREFDAHQGIIHGLLLTALA